MDAIGQLAGGIAHDFNNLLTVIIGRGLITSTAERAATLTQRLLAFSCKQVLQPRILDLGVVVSGMASMLQRVIGEHIGLVTLGDRARDRVNADPSQIEQVILNLVVNSRDAMPRGGTVTIETRNVEGPSPGVTLVVTDTGCGMDAETRSRMFERSSPRRGPGRGDGPGARPGVRQYRVLGAASPLHAIALAEAHAGVIDLLVTDVVMPGMSGRELAARLARLRPGMRILYTSGYPGQTIASHGVLDGHAALLRKPFAVETLTGAVRDTLDRSSVRKDVLEPVG